MPELGDLPVRQVGFYFRQLCSALLAMDAQNLAHRDLKLENLFISSNFEMKVGNFGMAITLPPGRTDRTYCGSSEYMAPEVGHQPYTPRVDVWSAGVILYVMIMRRYPSTDKRFGMLRVDPTQRLTIQQVVQDPWVQSIPTYGQPGSEELAAESRRVMAAREAKRLGALNTPSPSALLFFRWELSPPVIMAMGITHLDRPSLYINAQGPRVSGAPVFMGEADVHVADYSELPLLPADACPTTYFLLKGPSVLEIQQRLGLAAGAPADGWRDGVLEATRTVSRPLGLLLRLYRSPKDRQVVQLLSSSSPSV
ncbi:putative carbon catabolite derepressing protein kinase [Paratrimastix pyriformis]|uniref:Carbon catabolite derepressing protein kinase n=1 Tax=Paratrimastix pyriformis TaxID=342808 RepID=A0ABQ8UEE4_9EUKA|nr:putative carbon catabolite derepressing protein kinase [Paratrimastix pyriformis]